MVGVLGMLLTFVHAAALFILLGAEFLGLLMIMVYVGAIAVMFLFVLMTIDLDFGTLREGFAPYLPLGLLLVLALAAELLVAVYASGLPKEVMIVNGDDVQNIVQLGRVLFTDYVVPFQTAGLILLTAMIGAIVLTHRPRSDVRRQDVGMQIFRAKVDAMVKVSPAVGAGVKPVHWTPKSVAKKAKKS